MALQDFHLRKEVTIGNIFTTIMLAVTLVLGWADLDNRVETNRNKLAEIEATTLKNFDFQVANRQRVFDQLNQLRAEVQDTKVGLARLEAGIENANKSLDRLISAQFSKGKPQ